MGINLIDLYYETANLMVARLNLDVALAAQEADLLRRSYGAASAVNYASPVRRYVYMKMMAPRHAVIWREYTRAENLAFEEPDGTLQLNSIGAGPAPEVFGFLEGVQGALDFSRVDVRCLESEPEWAIAGTLASELYRSMTGKDVSLTYVNSSNELHRNAYTIGSMVISDLVRAGTQGLLQEIRKSLAPTEGLFIDTTKCRSPDTIDRFTSDYVRDLLVGRYVNFTERQYPESMRIAMEREIDGMTHQIEYELVTGFLYNGYRLRFT